MENFINVKGFPLVFVQNAAGDKFTVYQDGKEVRGIRSIRIDAGVEKFTTHEIEYLTGATSAEDEAILGRRYDAGKGVGGKATKSPNALRAEVIEKAKKFVAKIQSESDNGRNKEGGNRTYRLLRTTSEFIVNEKKRTVVALVRGAGTGTLFEKGIAICALSDVFNEHIGMAIALGKAYGLDVSEFEQAPQPDEVVPGMVVKSKEGVGYVTSPYTVGTIKDGDAHDADESGWIPCRYLEIISDTEAQY